MGEMLDTRLDILNLTKQLVSIRSIVNTDGEKVIADTLYKMVSDYPYSKANPDHVVIEKTINDELERYNVLAYVIGTKKKTNRTAIIMGHLDTVGVDDFNQQEDYAFKPEEWMEFLKGEDIPDFVREQLNPNEWLFGRGTLDMKSGLASNLTLLKYFSDHPDQLEGNLVFIAECDEEDSSNGILSALTTLKKWRDELGFDYLGAINAGFVAPLYEGDPNRYIYKGSVGKLLPAFYVAGAETHVGSAFEGLDPNFIVAESTKQISYNPALTNEHHGEYTLPPVALKQIDTKPGYTVQTALGAYVYYNFFTHSWTPKEVLTLLKEQAEIAFQNALDEFENRYKAFCDLSRQKYNGVPWKSRVMTYEEMDKMLIEFHGDDYKNHMEQFKTELLQDTTLDIRMYALRVVEEAWKWMVDKNPTIILFYASLYSPSVLLDGGTDKEENLNQVLEEAVNEIQPVYDKPIQIKNYFPFISDMSFMALNDDEAAIQAFTNNNPAWETKHFVDYDLIRELNIPIINIGPYGSDGHKKLERVEIEYSMEVVPNLTKLVIEKLLSNET